MQLSWRVLSLVMVFSITPGAAEAVENGVHLVSDGHLAHSAAHDQGHGDEHGPSEDEHGCNSVFHVCSCHSSASFVVYRGRTPAPAPLPLTLVSGLAAYEAATSDGVTDGILRPPIN